MARYTLKRMYFSKPVYSEDLEKLKGMTDKEFIEAKKKSPILSRPGAMMLTVLGGAGGHVGGRAIENSINKSRQAVGKRALEKSLMPAVIGGLTGTFVAGMAAKEIRRHQTPHREYNKRLKRAKRLAISRENSDWKRNLKDRGGRGGEFTK